MSQVDFNKLDSQGKKHGFWKDFMKNLKDLDTKGRLSTEMKLVSFNFRWYQGKIYYRNQRI
jgi:hypothetical protein